MTEQFKAGDMVQLKSGGPRMTIREIEDWDGGPRAWCQWFQGTDSKEGVFPLTSLTIATQRSGVTVTGSDAGGDPSTVWMR